MSQAPELIAESPFEHDRWSFTIRTFKTSGGYTVQSFLRAMPVSHAYEVDDATYESQRESGSDPLAALVELARTDLRNEVYRQWILHWASN